MLRRRLTEPRKNEFRSRHPCATWHGRQTRRRLEPGLKARFTGRSENRSPVANAAWSKPVFHTEPSVSDCPRTYHEETARPLSLLSRGEPGPMPAEGLNVLAIVTTFQAGKRATVKLTATLQRPP